MMQRRTLRAGRRGGGAALVLAVALAAGCDSGPAEMLDEINAAREGCTEEKLKAGDEECIRMFEAYAEMGADAMETYIGGMRALDEAIQRRGGIQFDTAGLGRAFSGGIVPGTDASELPAAPAPLPAAAYSRPGPAEPRAADPEGRAEPEASGRWSDMPPAPADAWSGGDSRVAPGPRRSAAPAERAPQGRRGALLPPDQRLRRPWIGDEDAPDPYVERERPDPAAGEGPAVEDPRREPVPMDGGWERDPYGGSRGGRWE